MSNAASEPGASHGRSARRGPTLLGVAVAVAVLSSGCGRADEAPSADPDEPADSSAAAPLAPSITAPSRQGRNKQRDVELPAPRDVVREMGRALDRRARAIRDGDRALFARGLDPSDSGFLTAQSGYFDNMAQLPLASFSYQIDPSSLVRQGRAYSVVVGVSTQLDGYDAAPSVAPDRFRFVSSGQDGALLLASVDDEQWESANGINPQPWEDRPIQVRTAPGILAVYDDGTAPRARAFTASMARDLSAVRSAVPYPMVGGASGTAGAAVDAAPVDGVVVYALSDTGFVAGLGNLPGGDALALDGVAFAVPASSTDLTTVATRVALNPDVFDATRAERDQLVRHELTHAVIGTRDDDVPLWLGEGLAEWVSVRPIAPQDRRVATSALAAARAGIESMPDDQTFNDSESAQHYGIAWWACEYLALTYGDAALFTVLDALEASPETSEQAQTRTVKQLLRFTPDQLARRGAKLMVSVYGRGARPPGGDRSPNQGRSPR